MEFTQLLQEAIDKELYSIIISNPRNNELGDKIKIRPVMIKDTLMFQATFYRGTQVIHKNYTGDSLKADIEEWMHNYKQLQAEYGMAQATVLVSKKGKMSIKKKLVPGRKKIVLEHNRKKKYILEEGKTVPFLVDLGVMTNEGKIIKSKYDKFRQINRYLEFVDDILDKLPQDKTVNILDFGCGKSYLTFALYYFLKEVNGYNVNIIGLDLKKDVIEHCNRLSEKYGYSGNLKFYVGDIANYNDVEKVDMVVTLHACDTATDYALAKAVEWGAKVILSVPCCQHEVNRQIENDMLSPILKYGLLKERISALITDGIRAEILEQNGYEVQILEFIDMEHTPKNILIRAVKNIRKSGDLKISGEKLNKCTEELNINTTLMKLL